MNKKYHSQTFILYKISILNNTIMHKLKIHVFVELVTVGFCWGLMTVWWTHKWKKQDVPCISIASPYTVCMYYIPLQSAAGRSIWTTLMHCNSQLRKHSVVLGQYCYGWVMLIHNFSFSEPYQHNISTINRSVHSPWNIWHASKLPIYDGNRDLGMI